MQENLAIASVPVQEWGALYEAEEALRVGTVFQDLNKPFFAASGGTAGHSCGCVSKGGAQDGRREVPKMPGREKSQAEQQERERMMTKIQETGFVLDDLRLYLDTHPDDRQGLTLLREKLAERRSLLSAFTQRFYPLTADCMADPGEENQASECDCWQKGPMPWEGACV